MDEEIQEWRNMWKQKKVKSLNLDEQFKQLNKLEKKEQLRKKAIIGAIIILLICFFIEDPEFDKTNINNIIGFSLAIIGMIISLIISYRTRLYLPNDQSLSDNQNSIRKLQGIATFNLKQLLIPMVILIIALNFLLLGFYDKGELFSYEFKEEYRLPIHLSTVALFFLSYYLHMPKLKKMQKEALESINEFETIFNEAPKN